MKKFLAALILSTLVPNRVAHPAVDAARAVYNPASLKPGWCRHYTKAALDNGAEGFVVLSRRGRKDRPFLGTGHVAPIIRDGRGRLQVLVERSRVTSDPLSPMLGKRTHRYLFRKTIPEGVDAEKWLHELFGAQKYESAFVMDSLHPDADCLWGKEREFGLRRNMSWKRQQEITGKAREACGIE
jgi:hypothetical protein